MINSFTNARINYNSIYMCVFININHANLEYFAQQPNSSEKKYSINVTEMNYLNPSKIRSTSTTRVMFKQTWSSSRSGLTASWERRDSIDFVHVFSEKNESLKTRMVHALICRFPSWKESLYCNECVLSWTIIWRLN